MSVGGPENFVSASRSYFVVKGTANIMKIRSTVKLL